MPHRVLCILEILGWVMLGLKLQWGGCLELFCGEGGGGGYTKISLKIHIKISFGCITNKNAGLN